VFDIAFSEIVVIAVVALVVIGPERLPKVARTLGHMFGRLQRYVNEVKADINREMELDELRKLQSEVQSAARDLETSMTGAAREMESGVRSVETQLNEAGASPSAATAGAVPEAEAGASAPADQLPVLSTDTAPSASAAHATAGEPPRQGALPGFDRI
jgi:sec-independent protein translocase protein TatB